MHKGFYYKLAFTNLGKNRKFYLPYMLSCILMVMLHFILCSLSYTDTWQTIPESAIVYTILTWAATWWRFSPSSSCFTPTAF